MLLVPIANEGPLVPIVSRGRRRSGCRRTLALVAARMNSMLPVPLSVSVLVPTFTPALTASEGAARTGDVIGPTLATALSVMLPSVAVEHRGPGAAIDEDAAGSRSSGH